MNLLLVLPDPDLRRAFQDLVRTLRGLDAAEAFSFASALEQATRFEDLAFLLVEEADPSVEFPRLVKAVRKLHPRVEIITVHRALPGETSPPCAPRADGLRSLWFPTSPLALAEALGGRPPEAAGAPPPAVEATPPPSADPPEAPYRILGREETLPWGSRCAAFQSHLNRTVTLHLLSPELSLKTAERENFLQQARARARLLHPLVLAVYEAGELGGGLFFAAERIEAPSLEDLVRSGQKLPVASILEIAHCVARTLAYLRAQGLPYPPLHPSMVLVPGEGPARLVNVAPDALPGGASGAPVTFPNVPEAADLGVLCGALLELAPAGAPRSFRRILSPGRPPSRAGVRTWSAFLDALTAWEKCNQGGPDPLLRGAPPLGRGQTPGQTGADPLNGKGTDAGNLRRRKARGPVGRGERKRREKRLVSRILAACGVLGLAVGVWTQFPESEAPERGTELPQQVWIAAGTYLTGAVRESRLASFSIDRTEINNRQYGVFLKWLRENPTRSRAHDHPGQPAGWSHTPEGWTGDSPVHPPPAPDSQVWELPVSGVGWWDAYAFAHWAGRALASEEEWEAAARGPRGLLFPWGDEESGGLARVQSRSIPAPEGPGSVTEQEDRSPCGTIGMGGNVAEWTGSAAEGEKRVVKGGHFLGPPRTLDTAEGHTPETRLPQLGFRTRSRKTS